MSKAQSTSAISLHSESAASDEDDPTCDSEDGTGFDFPLRGRNHSSFTSEDKTASLGSRAGSDVEMLAEYHANGGHKESNASSPTSDDATECFEEQNQAPTKKILKKVSAYFNTGELVAIMGPSGCGKTTLLDLLTGRRRTGHIEGQVYVNGVGLGQVQDWYSRKIGYVLQLAVPYYEELTVRQNLFFAAHMRLPRETSAADKYERVEQIIAETGLTQMADTVIGGSVGPGLSGGQKRRLCVALQLINMPSVLFLDEPTSGRYSCTILDPCFVSQRER
ncbi:PREDICTED: ABC transporter G family member 22-like [Acropora digitifera]|uniref:ABC transporter G family member 22-like n=1 Tax=Acropora digitifera TaxID=70779 RepID=UPI00077A009C|nr:PREDICTED: ABC transporter G family member 22-like [Acropora digitifera]